MTTSAHRERGEAGKFLTVGTKLAGATVALVLVVTAGVYFKLSRYQRENLLGAKEMAAAAVGRLFADSCAAPVVFSDETAIKDSLATLGRNDDIEYAAIWSVDRAGKVGKRLGELARGAPEVVTFVPATIVSERRRDRVFLLSPVHAPDGGVVAVAVMAFSLTRENAAIAAVERQTLIVSALIAAGLTALLLAIARLAIVKPLGKLVFAAQKLEEGSVIPVDVHSNDEIGQLAAAFRSMAVAIQSREEHIRTRNRDMRLVLDNVGQGFVTLDLDGKMSDERSRVVDEWFGSPPAGATFWDFLRPIEESVSHWFEMGWATVREDIMPLELCLEQLPRCVRKEASAFELSYRPIMNGERVDKVIVVITDVTARIERERAEQTQREVMSLFHRILSDRPAFEGFFAEATGLVDAIEAFDGSDLGLLKRQIHTLKGNTALFGIESVATFCHELETRIDESPELFGEHQKERLRLLWLKVIELRSRFVNDGDGRIEIDREEYDAFLKDLGRRVEHGVLLATASTWTFERASRRLSLFGEQIGHLGARLGKARINVRLDETKIRLPPALWGPFWSAFAHVVRNAVDHGIETKEERVRACKPEVGTISLGVAHEGPHVIVTLRDDGRGIDWTRISERAKARCMPHETRQDLEEALFAEGLSTRVDATMTSGRGLGLATIRDLVRQMHGRIEIDSLAGKGTTFRFILPQTMLFER
jgi:signal transduction histidine kinase